MVMLKWLKRRWPLLMALAVGLGVWVYFDTRTSPEAQVKKVLRELCESGTKADGDGTTSGIVKCRGAMNLFAAETELRFGTDFFSGNTNPEEIAANLNRFRMLFSQVTIGMKDVKITFKSPEEATVDFIGTLHGTLKSGSRVDELRELICTLKKQDDKWRITALRVREILER